ncbi:CAP domain-containing protein [Pedobacter sp. FW305-3-2-15-E-R2A2]|uniref:CAP domain-containing protein n=1 Tax=Pedobacter sp. FW305-3-2-15-E-R2A2 TaxID=3140251 RepID=UPI0031402B8B
MKMITIALCFLFPLLSPGTSEKSDPDDSWTKEELRMANTAGDVDYLTAEEKDMVIYMNLARMDGAKFFDTYFQDFVDAHNLQMQQYGNYNEVKVNRNDSYYRSLRRDLERVKDFPVFWPDEALSNVAKLHAKDLNRNNFAGHNSKDGRTVQQRIGRVYPNKSNGECLAFGFTSGLSNVCMLLLDKGVADLGHRKLILNTSSKLNTVGLSIQPHKRYRYCAVIDFVSLPE